MQQDVQGQLHDPRLLIDDAILIASYGRRTGILTDTALFNGIQKAKAVDDLTWGSPELVDLQSATNDAVKQIRPVTLMDLKSWDPFATESQPLSRRCISGFGKSLMVLFTFLLIVVCGYYTIWQKRASEIFDRAVHFDTAQQDAEIYDLINLWVLGGNISDILDKNKLAVDPVVREARLKAREIRFTKIQRDHLRSSFNDLKNSYSPLAYTAYLEYERNKKKGRAGGYGASVPYKRPGEQEQASETAPGDETQRAEVAAFQSTNTDAKQQSSGSEKTEASATATIAKTPSTLAQSEQRYFGTGLGASDACTSSRDKLIKLEQKDASEQAAFALARFQQDYLVREAAKEHIKCLLQIGDRYPQLDYQATLDLQLKDELRNKLHVLSRWTLPALYGALGAMLFTIRRLLNPVVPDPNVMHIMLRVSLGAFAGVSLGWFGTQAGSPEELQVAGISLGLLTLAFLFGFAIDVFFTLLDKMVAVASSAVSNIGTAK